MEQRLGSHGRRYMNYGTIWTREVLCIGITGSWDCDTSTTIGVGYVRIRSERVQGRGRWPSSQDAKSLKAMMQEDIEKAGTRRESEMGPCHRPTGSGQSPVSGNGQEY